MNPVKLVKKIQKIKVENGIHYDYATNPLPSIHDLPPTMRNYCKIICAHYAVKNEKLAAVKSVKQFLAIFNIMIGLKETKDFVDNIWLELSNMDGDINIFNALFMKNSL